MELGKLYNVPISGISTLVRAVDGEVEFNEPGIGHGWVHFAHPETGKKLGFSGVAWFDDHATKIEDAVEETQLTLKRYNKFLVRSKYIPVWLICGVENLRVSDQGAVFDLICFLDEDNTTELAIQKWFATKTPEVIVIEWLDNKGGTLLQCGFLNVMPTQFGIDKLHWERDHYQTMRISCSGIFDGFRDKRNSNK